MNRIERLGWYRDKLLAAADLGKEELRECKRQLGRTDLFYLLVFLLNRVDLNRDFFFERCRELQANPDGYLDLWAREHGKALDCDTPVLTANRGWVRHGDLKAFDRVFAPSGEQVRVIANTGPQLGTNCFAVRTCDGAEVVASEQHLWTVLQKRKLRISGTVARRVDYVAHIVSTSDLGKPWAILPRNGALQLPNADLPVDPYVLGVWLGDGTTGSPNVTSGLEDCDEMAALLGSHVAVHKRRHANAVTLALGNGIRFKRGSNGFSNALRALGVWKDKHVPEAYLKASPDQRLALLQGLMDTDGYCNLRGTAYFTSINQRLADAVAHLVRSLGKRATTRIKTMAVNGEPYQVFEVTFQALGLKPFRLQRKLARCGRETFTVERRVRSVTPVPSRPVNCIQVVGGNYLAGRELVPTHNSSIGTFGQIIQDILNNPDITVGIFSFNRPTAKAFLRQIKLEFETNEELKALYPDVLWQNPKVEAPKWSEDEGIIVRRKGNPKESTVEAWGLVDGQPTSKHFGLLNYDDAVTLDSVTTPEMMKKVLNAWENSLNLSTEHGRFRYRGTRWHTNDLYREIIARSAAKERRYAVTKDGTVTGEPQLWSRELVAKKRREMGPYTFAAQMLLDPAADKNQGFRREWLRFYPRGMSGDGMNRYLLVDPASKKKKENDYTSMAVIGLGPDNNYYLLDGVRDRLNLTERADALFQLHRRWRPKGVGYEEYGLQSDIEHMQSEMTHQEYRFEITPLGGRTAKEDRIKRLVPHFENGRFWLPDTLHKTDYEGRVIDIVSAFIE
ncbi:MAG TPA: LAGLIDADG family homing endonuclease, partial [Terriglobales bacterium]|nr:LAGLIDADG family homing endonuclease [Terriglobales bacterium]